MKHKTREEWLEAAKVAMADWFPEAGAKFPNNVAVSCGWPATKALAAKGRRIGEAWASEASKRKHFELFVSPWLDEPTRVLGVLLHEMIHAAVGLKVGHKGPFRKVALALGLEGKMTATTEGPELTKRLKALAHELGDYPHKSLDKMTNGTKKQTTRLKKIECPDCGYTARTTEKWLAEGLPTCVCGTPMIEAA